MIPPPQFKRRERPELREQKQKLVKRLTDLIDYCNDPTRPLPEGATVIPHEPQPTATEITK
jgi:hypothetical protein